MSKNGNYCDRIGKAIISEKIIRLPHMLPFVFFFQIIANNGIIGYRMTLAWMSASVYRTTLYIVSDCLQKGSQREVDVIRHFYDMFMRKRGFPYEVS